MGRRRNIIDAWEEYMTLKRFGLVMVLVTVILSLAGSMLVIFEQYTAGRVFATLTMLTLATAFIAMAINTLFAKEEQEDE